jgi:glucosamine-6-phosphate deaminase
VRLVILDDYTAVSDAAAAIALEQLRRRPETVFGMPTGGTPVGLYQRLAASGADFSRAATVNLDEYLGIGPDHRESFYQFMLRHLWQHINLAPERRYIPDGLAPDPQVESARYERTIEAAGGIDLLYLGLGTNGHIAFNEPGTPWEWRTHVGNLTEETIRANAAGFGSPDRVPRQAITIGIANILEARQIVLLVSGKGKAQILREVCHGPLTPALPATALRSHPNVTVLADRAAAALLESAAG